MNIIYFHYILLFLLHFNQLWQLLTIYLFARVRIIGMKYLFV